MSLNINLRLLLAIITFFLLVATRLPFLSQPLLGEEGMFAVMVTGYGSTYNSGVGKDDEFPQKIKDNCYQVISHLNGVGDTVIGPSRNIVPYCFLGLVIKPLVANFHLSLNDFDSKSLFIRSVFLFLSSIGFISLCTIALMVSKRLTGLRVLLPSATLLLFASSKLAIGSSIQPQIDGVFGFLLLSNSALFVYAGAIHSKNNFQRFLNNLIAGFLMALCKIEWPLVLIVAICIGIVGHISIVLYKKSKDLGWNTKKTSIVLSICSGLLIGAGAGMYACFLFSPFDYISGISLMGSINGSKTDSFYFSAIKLISLNYEVLVPIFVMMMFGLVGIYKNKNNIFENQIGLLILYFWSIGLILGFLQSGWIGDGFPRYFLPSLLISGVFGITQIPYIFDSNTHTLSSGIFLIFLLSLSVFNVDKEVKKYNAGRSITVPDNYVERRKMMLKAGSESKRDPYIVAVISPTMRYYFPEANFISVDIGMKDVLNKKLPDSRFYLVMY